MIRMSDLMADRTYERWIHLEPTLPEASTNKAMNFSPPWVVYVQRKAGGPWGKREFWKYSKALKFLKKALALDVHDAALNNKRNWSPPPNRIVRIKGKYHTGADGVRRQVTKQTPWVAPMVEGDEGDMWCGFCRRPTVFRFFAKHPRLTMLDPTVRRCRICGASERIAPIPALRRG